MAVIAAAAVALPLLRHPKSRILGVIAAVMVIGVAAGLYPLWSNWDWHASGSRGAAGPDVIAMVTKLEKHLQDEPSDQPGWLLLGRSYIALQRLDEAVVAYDHANRLGKNADALLGLGEAMSLQAGGQITPQASEMFEQALGLAPANPKALLYGGFAAATRGDRELARSRWLALEALNPPPQVKELLDARIAELGADTGRGSAAAAPGGASAAPGTSAASGASAPATGVSPGTSPSGAGTNPPAEGSSPALVTVNISITPALRPRLTKGASLFVFAREPGSRGPPLAVKRLTSAAIGTQVELSAADSMLPGHALRDGQQVSITARVSFGGQPTPAAGDLYGELSYDVGRDRMRSLVIDRIAE